MGITAAIRAVEEFYGKEEDFDASALKSPSDTAKFHGIPGHWRVTRPDGTVYGRAIIPPAPPPPEEKEEEEQSVEGKQGEEVPKVEAEQTEEGEKEAEEKKNAEEEEPPPPPPSWEEIYAEHLGG